MKNNYLGFAQEKMCTVFVLSIFLMLNCQRDENVDVSVDQPSTKTSPTQLQNRAREIVHSKESEFVQSLGFSEGADVKLIGFKTIYIDDESVSDFNHFFFDHRETYDTIKGFHYDPEKAEMRIYFPVNGAIIKSGIAQYETSAIGDVQLGSNADIASFKVIGRKRTDRVVGVRANIIRNDTIFLAQSVGVDHLIDNNVLVFDFGEKMLHNHHGMIWKDGKAVSPRAIPCYQNHGGMICTYVTGIHNLNCPILSNTVCMDYNGHVTDCVNYSSGWKRFRNFAGSDCQIATSRGYCWNEYM